MELKCDGSVAPPEILIWQKEGKEERIDHIFIDVHYEKLCCNGDVLTLKKMQLS